MRSRTKCNKILNDNGFTLVELVIVVVILVILATLIVPTFTKYFNKYFDEKTAEKAKSVLDSSQVIINELYANGTHNLTDNNTSAVCFIEGTEDTGGNASVNPKTFKISGDSKDCDIHNNPISKKILELCNINIRSNSPCIVLVGTGRYDIYADPTNPLYDPVKAYTVYVVIYQEVFEGKCTYVSKDEVFPGKPYTKKKYNGKDVNYMNVDNDDIYLQFYALKTGKDNNTWMKDIWKYIK